MTFRNHSAPRRRRARRRLRPAHRGGGPCGERDHRRLAQGGVEGPEDRLSRPTFKMQGQGRTAQVCVHVCKSKKKNADGVICTRGARSARPRRAAPPTSASRSSTTTRRLLAQLARHLLLAGAPHQLRGRRSTTASRRARSSSSRSGSTDACATSTSAARAGSTATGATARSIRRSCRSGAGSSTTRRVFETVEVNSTFYRLAKPEARGPLGDRDARRTSSSRSRPAATSPTSGA